MPRVLKGSHDLVSNIDHPLLSVGGSVEGTNYSTGKPSNRASHHQFIVLGLCSQCSSSYIAVFEMHTSSYRLALPSWVFDLTHRIRVSRYASLFSCGFLSNQ